MVWPKTPQPPVRIVVTTKAAVPLDTWESAPLGAELGLTSPLAGDGAVGAGFVTGRFNARKRTLDAGERRFEACAHAMEQATRQVVDGLVRVCPGEKILFGLVDQLCVSLLHEEHLSASIDAQVVHDSECGRLVARHNYPFRFR